MITKPVAIPDLNTIEGRDDYFRNLPPFKLDFYRIGNTWNTVLNNWLDISPNKKQPLVGSKVPRLGETVVRPQKIKRLGESLGIYKRKPIETRIVAETIEPTTEETYKRIRDKVLGKPPKGTKPIHDKLMTKTLTQKSVILVNNQKETNKEPLKTDVIQKEIQETKKTTPVTVEVPATIIVEDDYFPIEMSTQDMPKYRRQLNFADVEKFLLAFKCWGKGKGIPESRLKFLLPSAFESSEANEWFSIKMKQLYDDNVSYAEICNLFLSDAPMEMSEAIPLEEVLNQKKTRRKHFIIYLPNIFARRRPN